MAKQGGKAVVNKAVKQGEMRPRTKGEEMRRRMKGGNEAKERRETKQRKEGTR